MLICRAFGTKGLQGRGEGEEEEEVKYLKMNKQRIALPRFEEEISASIESEPKKAHVHNENVMLWRPRKICFKKEVVNDIYASEKHAK